jgi:hypothetical protein
MQTAYSPPPQRSVDATIFTIAGPMRGAFLVPALRIFVEYLNYQQDFIKLKDVTLPGVEKTVPFFALQRDSVIFIIPSAVDAIVPAGTREPRTASVSCAFPGGALSGSLHLPQGVRVSDFLLQKAYFFPMFDCTSYVRAGGQTKSTPDIRIALVNSRRMIGISEPPFI